MRFVHIFFDEKNLARVPYIDLCLFPTKGSSTSTYLRFSSNIRKIAGKKQPASKMPRAAASKVETKVPRGKRGVAVKKEPETSVLQGMEKLSVKEIVAMKEGLTGNIKESRAFKLSKVSLRDSLSIFTNYI